MIVSSIRRRALAAVAGVGVAVTFTVAIGAAPAMAATFSNTGAITIPSAGQSTPYPSTIAVSGLSGNTTDVNVTLNGLSHTWPDDLDILVVSPTGQRVVLTSDNGGSLDVTSINLTFDDAAGGFLPDEGQIVGGTYRPSFGATGNTAFNGTPPAPAGPYSYSLANFNNQSPIGTWSMYVFDDAGGDSGTISGGWTLNITTTAPSITSFTPTTGTAGTVVTITGTNFSGTTAVRFGGVAATVFVENSATQITATVPSGALSGPISVTTPLGTGTSATNFTVTATPPSITSFTPSEGKVGGSVTITGTNLNGATAVTFNGALATFTVNSATQITATIPTGASTGPIGVTTPEGSTASTTAFVVRHVRTITLDVGGRTARGKVTVVDGFAACSDNVPVNVKYDDGPGGFSTLGSTTTDGSGRYHVGGSRGSGRYRATATTFTTPSGDICNARKVTESKG